MTKWWQNISTKYPIWVVAISAIMILLLGWYGLGVFDKLSDSSSMHANQTLSTEANEIIEREFGATPSNQVVLFSRVDDSLGDADSALFTAEVNRLLEPLGDEATSIMTYSTTGSDNFISHDRSMTYAVVNIDGDSKEIFQRLTDFASDADQSKLSITIGGEAALVEETNQIVTEQLAKIELVSLPILLILLLFFFRSIVAALVPLGIAVATVLGAFAIARLLATFVTIDTYAVNVITILGLGLSIDYALLSVNRFREELPKGVDKAVKKMIATSGHTIIFSGTTVIACLLALLVFPFDIMHSISIGGASAVLVAMATTYFVLPSVLKLLGQNINRGQIRKPKQVTAINKKGFWHKVATLTTTHPVISLIVGLVIVALSLIPIVQFKPGNMDYNWVARGTQSQQVLRSLSEDFPSSTADMTAVLTFDDSMSSEDRLALACDTTEQISNVNQVQTVLSATPISAELPCDAIKMLSASNMLPPELQIAQATYMRDGALKFDIFLEDTDMDGEEEALLAIRDITTSEGTLSVTGTVAQFYDSNHAYYKSAPWAIAIIAISMIVLLAFALKSIVVPLQAVVINSIGLAISLSVIVGVFQHGWLSGLTGWPQVDGIVLAAPILVASIAFGLAMDYSVFLYSRMRETYDRTGDSTEAVREGIVKTGPIITAAAGALFVVVIGFLSSSVLFMQIIGLGMAVAVIVDAFFIRLILVPSIMTLLGKHSWR